MTLEAHAITLTEAQRVSVSSRFWPRVKKTDNCWLWQGARRGGPRDYGGFSLFGRHCLAHRIAWVLEYGAVAANTIVMHACDNPPCVRPSHLVLGTVADNTHDAFSKGRRGKDPGVYARGARIATAKLSEEDVRRIRTAAAGGASSRQLGAAYGVDHTTVASIVRRCAWRHVI